MTEKLIIEGGRKLEGTIDVRGSKNAAAPIIAATLLTSKLCILDNIPLIADIKKMLEALKVMGADVEFLDKRKVKICCKNVKPENLNFELVNSIRASILFVGPLIARFKEVQMPHPGGCVIGSRPIDTHINALTRIGVKTEERICQSNNNGSRPNTYHFKAKDGLTGNEIVMDEFSVTATENILMAAVLAKGKTIVKIAAAEPHIQHLALFLNKMGADIKGAGTNTIEINGKESLSGAEYSIPYDYIEAGTFILLGIAGKSNICIRNTPISHLELLLNKLQRFGANIKIKENEVVVSPSDNICIKKIQTMPHPGIPTDLQAPLGVLATQTEGLTLIHDPLYEGRLKYLEELNKMGAEIVVCDPHRAIINGPAKLYGANLNPLDLRGGAALIIAGVIAEGTTIIKDVSQTDRGYEEIDKRLQGIGANIKREQY